MAVAEFSWTKILCFLGVALCFFACIVSLATGIQLIVSGEGFRGAMTIIGSCALGAWAVYLYKYYNKWCDKQRK